MIPSARITRVYFSTGSIVTVSGPDTLNAPIPESIRPSGTSPFA
jgi:hypothetical protein